jgi:hypothetical protein
MASARLAFWGSFSATSSRISLVLIVAYSNWFNLNLPPSLRTFNPFLKPAWSAQRHHQRPQVCT